MASAQCVTVAPKTTGTLNKAMKRNPNRSYKIIVSAQTYKAFKPTFTLEDNQRSILDFLSKVDKLVAQLLRENKLLTTQIEQKRIAPELCAPNFLQTLIEIQRKKNSKKRIFYDDDMLKISLYYFLLGGRQLYETLALNLPFPSLALIYKYLHDKRTAIEGEFRFEIFAAQNKERGGVNYAWVSEDDTKVVEGIRYNPHEDTIVGLCLPIDHETGTPKINFFKFNTIKEVKEHLFKEKAASYVKLVTIRALSPTSKTFVLALYGTNGSDKFEPTLQRWKYIVDEFAAIGVVVMGEFLALQLVNSLLYLRLYFIFYCSSCKSGISSDGAISFLKTMTVMTKFNDGEDMSIPREFRGFFFAQLDLHKTCVINDGLHLVVKIIWRMMRETMTMGNHKVSRAIILEILNTFGKSETGIDQSVITDVKDAMNYTRAEKLCSNEFYKHFDDESQVSTRVFLKLATYVNDALNDTSLPPEERVRKIWYAVFISRMWRLSTNLKTNTSLRHDFLTSNAYTCLETNAHNLLKYLIKCREVGAPECFLPYNANSQDSEKMFRSYRSMGTTNNTVVNFTVSELLHLQTRASALNEIKTHPDLEHDFDNASKKIKEKKMIKFVPTALPTNQEIRRLVIDALEEAMGDAILVGIDQLISVKQDQDNPNFFPKMELPATSELSIDEAYNKENDKKASTVVEMKTEVDNIAIEDGQVAEQEIFLGDILSTDFEEDLSEPPATRGFVKVKGKVKHLRKSLVVWTLSYKRERLTQDRLRRFIDNNKRVIRKDDYIFIGHFAKMRVNQAEEFVQILGFRLLTGKKAEIGKSLMPIRDKTGQLIENIGVMANLYRQKLEDGRLLLHYVQPLNEVISFKHFIKHVENDELYILFGGEK